MKKISIAFFLLITNFLLAQDTGEDKWGAWYMYFGTNKVSEKLSIHSEAQFRFYETTGNFNQLLLRTGLNYHFKPNAIATIGYGYIGTDVTYLEFPGETDLKEHRIFQQFILKNKVGEFLFEHRYRLEQRFIDFGDTNDTQHRARYRLQLTLPLTDTFFLNFYDEVFFKPAGQHFWTKQTFWGAGNTYYRKQ